MDTYPLPELIVGDGDAQVLLLPEDVGTHERQAVIIDAGIKNKISWLIDIASQLQSDIVSQ